LKRLFPVLFVFAFLQLSCRKEENASWETNLIAPLLKSSLGVENIIQDSLLAVNSDHSLSVVYKRDFYSLSIDSLIHLPDTTISTVLNFPFGSLSLSPGQQILSTQKETRYSMGDVALSLITVKSGKIKINLKSKVKEKTRVVYKMPSAKKNGVAFEFETNLDAATADASSQFNTELDLSGYTIDLTGLHGNKVNSFYTSFAAYVDPNGNQVQVMSSDSIILYTNFTEIIPYYVKGYFGKTDVNIPSGFTPLNLFNQVVSGNIKIEDVKMDLIIENSIGADSRIKINNLTSFNTRTNQTIDLTHSTIATPLNINRALASPFQTTIYPINFNNSNSNLKQFVENIPDNIGYDIDFTLNPYGNVSNGNDFLYTDKTFNVKLNLEMPLAFAANNLTLIDTTEFSISDIKKQVKEGTFNLIVRNGFPFKAQLQLLLLNESLQIVDSLFLPSQSIEAGIINSDKKVSESSRSVLIIEMPHEKINKIAETKKAIIRVTFNTGNYPEYYKIYDDYKFDLKLTGDFIYLTQPLK